MKNIEKEDVQIVSVSKLGGFYDSDNHRLNRSHRSQTIPSI